MKHRYLNIQSLYIFAAFALIFTVISCNQMSKKEVVQKSDVPATPDEQIQQTPDQLLGGTYQAISYSGFRSGQHPDRGNGAINPSYEETLEDLKLLTQNNMFNLLRLYDCGENSSMVLKVIKENNIDMKVMLGMWLDAELSNHEACWWLNEPIPEEKLAEHKAKNLAEINRGIELAKEYKDIAIAINVGNEALVGWTDHLVNVDTVISYVKMVKAAVDQKVSVAENCQWWADEGAELAKAVDFLAIHTYPLWTGHDIDTAMENTINDVLNVRKSMPNKTIVISEAGWATIASEFGERASEEKQVTYFNDLMAWSKKMNMTTFFFEAFDEDWKGNPDNMMGAEKHWGLYNVDRTPKMVIKELLKQN